jgi:hypothetical protein
MFNSPGGGGRRVCTCEQAFFVDIHVALTNLILAYGQGNGMNYISWADHNAQNFCQLRLLWAVSRRSVILPTQLLFLRVTC